MADYYRLPFPNPDLIDGFHSTLGRASPHRGVDFPQAAGAAIPAVGDGWVVLIEWSAVLGWVTVTRHTRSTRDRLRGCKPVFFGYCHQDSPGWRISVGDPVKLGQVLGRVGVQGRNGSAANGTHLHLTGSHSLRGVFAGEVFDPVKFIRRYPQPTPKPTSNTYTVRAGDTLDGIARSHHVAGGWQRLAQVNELPNPDHIEAGDVLRLA